MASPSQDLLALAAALGYERRGRDGRNHHVVVHPATGAQVWISANYYDGPVRQIVAARLRRGAPKAAVDALRQRKSTARPRKRGTTEQHATEQARAAYEQRVDELEHARLPGRADELDPRDASRLDDWTWPWSVLRRAVEMKLTPVELRAALATPHVRVASGTDERRALYSDDRITLVVDEADLVVVGVFWRSEHDKQLEARRHARARRRITQEEQ